MIWVISFVIFFLGLVSLLEGIRRVLAFIALLIVGCFFAMVATNANLGVEGFEHEEGMSLRQDSTTRRTGFFVYYGSRSHRGGGILGGK